MLLLRINRNRICSSIGTNVSDLGWPWTAETHFQLAPNRNRKLLRRPPETFEWS